MMIRFQKEPCCSNCAWWVPSEDPESLGRCEVATESSYARVVLVSDDRDAELLTAGDHYCSEFVEFDEDD